VEIELLGVEGDLLEDDVRSVRGFAQLRQGVAQDAGDVHLRAADAVADLALREVFDEPALSFSTRGRGAAL
jgi:hypothetical protein